MSGRFYIEKMFIQVIVFEKQIRKVYFYVDYNLLTNLKTKLLKHIFIILWFQFSCLSNCTPAIKLKQSTTKTSNWKIATWMIPPGKFPPGKVPPKKIPTLHKLHQGNSHPENCYPGYLPTGQIPLRKFPPRITPTRENFHPAIY